MSYQRPEPGIYIRKSDGVRVQVSGSTGIEWNDSVTCHTGSDLGGKRTWHVRLENFWKKYEPAADAGREETP